MFDKTRFFKKRTKRTKGSAGISGTGIESEVITEENDFDEEEYENYLKYLIDKGLSIPKGAIDLGMQYGNELTKKGEELLNKVKELFKRRKE